MLLVIALIAGVYLWTGCAVAAGSWDSVRRRHPNYPTTKIGVFGLALGESARWPLTLAGK
jgi:hypothetical protein